MPRVTIDGQPVDVTPGSNLLAAARKLGIDIPALCYLPGAPPNTACMLCIVRRLDTGRIVPACATPAEDGLEVASETPEIHALRRATLELILSDHVAPCADLGCTAAASGAESDGAAAAPGSPAAPADAPGAGDEPGAAAGPGAAAESAAAVAGCACGGLAVCRLRRYALRYGADPARFAGGQRRPVGCGEHPEISFDPGKCILCGICIEVARQSGEPLGLTWIGRGFDVRIGVPFDEPLAAALTVAARRCAGACPTGALTLRARWEPRPPLPPAPGSGQARARRR